MIRMTQVSLSIYRWKETRWDTLDFQKEEYRLLKEKAAKILSIKEKEIKNLVLVKKSIDARKKNEIKYSYTIDIEINAEEKIVKKKKSKEVFLAPPSVAETLLKGKWKEKEPPVVVGTGPAGLFCALFLAKAGLRPIVLERGDCVEERIKAVETFWKTNELDTESNVSFGEGGAGTFSDGKLGTLVKDRSGRNGMVLKTFVEHGAPAELLYLNKPHIGTDRLRNVVKNIREHIIDLGGTVRFRSKLTGLLVEDGKLNGIVVNDTEKIPCQVLVLAPGHSARDTFEMLLDKGMEMKPKAFAIGLRMEHSQKLISQNQYGDAYTRLPPADYKLTHQASNGRGVYSFCMCPGGYVVNSSSEQERIVVNGMSDYKRDSPNANSALIVTVAEEDFAGQSPLSGVYFQRKWEEAAYKAGRGNIPLQLYHDFTQNKITEQLGSLKPSLKGTYHFADLNLCLPQYVVHALKEGILAFDKKIRGFADGNAILEGVETRTSSPVKLLRDESLMSSIKGVYPCGEGAGYAGGITSAAMDGIRVYEAIVKNN